MLGSGDGVEAGQVVPQVVPTGGFSTSSLSSAYFFGDDEVVNYGVANGDDLGVTALTINAGSPTLVQDFTSTNGQQADVTQSGGTVSINSNGTFDAGGHGAVNAIMVSTTEFVTIGNTGSTYPTIEVAKQ
jgi:hypothetical protein